MSMNFPTIKENQFAVLMANSQTGVVLNSNFLIYSNDKEDQSVYQIFEDIDQAKSGINRISQTNGEIEFVIYNSKMEIVEFIKA